MNNDRVIKVFLDNDPEPFAEFQPPVKFLLDTTKIADGNHILRIVAKSTNGVEGVKTIPFEVRNGPSIDVVGLDKNDIVNEQIPITINAYGSERKDIFIITGSETPKAIPAWVWALLVAFSAFAIFYFVMYWKQGLYESFF